MHVLLMILMLHTGAVSTPIQIYDTKEQCLADAIYWKHHFKRETWVCRLLEKED